MEGESKGILMVGGTCGLLAGAFVLAALGAFLTTNPPQPWTVEQTLVNIPANFGAFYAVYHLGYIASFLLVVFFLGLYRALHKAKPAGAFVGVVFGILAAGLGIAYFLAALNTSFVLAKTYADSAPQDRFAVVVAAQAVTGILGGLLAAAQVSAGLSFIAFGISMLGSADFAKALGSTSLVLGLALIGVLLAPVSSAAAFPIVAVFALLFGGKLYSLSRTPRAVSH